MLPCSSWCCRRPRGCWCPRQTCWPAPVFPGSPAHRSPQFLHDGISFWTSWNFITFHGDGRLKSTLFSCSTNKFSKTMESLPVRSSKGLVWMVNGKSANLHRWKFGKKVFVWKTPGLTLSLIVPDFTIFCMAVHEIISFSASFSFHFLFYLFLGVSLCHGDVNKNKDKTKWQKQGRKGYTSNFMNCQAQNL